MGTLALVEHLTVTQEHHLHPTGINSTKVIGTILVKALDLEVDIVVCVARRTVRIGNHISYFNVNFSQKRTDVG